MICQKCKQNPATLHFTQIINGEKNEVHLCDKCSQEKSEMLLDGHSNFSINNLLAGLLNIEPNYTSQKQNPFISSDDIRCDHCHMTYTQFARIGKFGCASCYEAFNKQLEPILRRLHSGNSAHTGKIPKRIGGDISLRKKVAELKQALQVSIKQEEFEQAAKLRDEIRALEKQPGHSDSEERSDRP
ncbi:MAG: UvrB/UvrC motif-containing protein [Bacillus sp. (in: firmicutes)]